jgi:hypothetical protein
MAAPATSAREILALDAEQCVLSAMLRDSRAVGAVVSILEPGDFADGRNRRIFAAMIGLANREIPADPVIVGDELARRGEYDAAGGKDYLGWLIDVSGSSVNVEYHAHIVLERAKRRGLRKLGSDLISLAEEGSETAAELAQRFARAVEPLATFRLEPLANAVSALDTAELDPVSWMIEDLWTRGEPGAIAGEGGALKSSAGGVALAGAVAGGYKAWGKYRTIQRPSLIVSVEDSRAVVRMRLEAIAQGHGWDRARVLGNVHIIATHDISLADASWQAHIGREAERLGAGCVVFDSWADLLGDKNEDRATDIRPIVAWIRGLATKTQGMVCVIAHATKPADGRRSIDRVRGSTALINAMRTAFYFEDSDIGVRVEHIKANRGPKVPSFVLTKEIVSAEHNRAHWVSARFVAGEAKAVALDRAEEFVMVQVTASPRHLTSSDLRKAAGGSGISNQDIGRALSVLEKRGRIAFEPGAKNAKFWYPVSTAPSLPNGFGNQTETCLPCLPTGCPASAEQPARLVAPLRGAGNQAQALAGVGNQRELAGIANQADDAEGDL